MDDKLKKVVQWALFLIILCAFVGGMLIPWLFVTYAPTFSPELNLSGFEGTMNTSSIIVSFASAGLGAFSIFQASSSSREMKNLLDKVDFLNQQQAEMKRALEPLVHFGEAKNQSSKWTPDTTEVE